MRLVTTATLRPATELETRCFCCQRIGLRMPRANRPISEKKNLPSHRPLKIPIQGRIRSATRPLSLRRVRLSQGDIMKRTQAFHSFLFCPRTPDEDCNLPASGTASQSRADKCY